MGSGCRASVEAQKIEMDRLLRQIMARMEGRTGNKRIQSRMRQCLSFMYNIFIVDYGAIRTPSDAVLLLVFVMHMDVHHHVHTLKSIILLPTSTRVCIP